MGWRDATYVILTGQARYGMFASDLAMRSLVEAERDGKL